MSRCDICLKQTRGQPPVFKGVNTLGLSTADEPWQEPQRVEQQEQIGQPPRWVKIRAERPEGHGHQPGARREHEGHEGEVAPAQSTLRTAQRRQPRRADRKVERQERPIPRRQNRIVVVLEQELVWNDAGGSNGGDGVFSVDEGPLAGSPGLGPGAGGGGGSGGTIWLQAGHIANDGLISAQGGTGVGGGQSNIDPVGGFGRIRTDKDTQTDTGTILPRNPFEGGPWYVPVVAPPISATVAEIPLQVPNLSQQELSHPERQLPGRDNNQRIKVVLGASCSRSTRW